MRGRERGRGRERERRRESTESRERRAREESRLFLVYVVTALTEVSVVVWQLLVWSTCKLAPYVSECVGLPGTTTTQLRWREKAEGPSRQQTHPWWDLFPPLPPNRSIGRLQGDTATSCSC